jgi:para-aminobenzoate synthetase/4-amino-4-deoxychorismate lyase
VPAISCWTPICSAAARFQRPLDLARVHRHLQRLAEGFAAAPQRVRLLVAPDGRPSATATPLHRSPPPSRVVLAASPADVLDDPFVAHKTTRRRVYDDARAAALARRPEAEDVLLWNARGELTESSIANLVVDLAGTLVTPPASSGLLPGVYRQHLLQRGLIQERVLGVQELRAARALYLANSVRGLWRVRLLAAPGDF